MNCQDFESLVGDLARGRALEARAQEAARAHHGACAGCAARLADERSLADGLRGLAASTAAAAASPRVEANLLAAFRAQATPDAGGEALCAAAEKVLPFARPSAPRRWSWMKAAAAAATAAAAAVTLFVLVPPRQTQTMRGGGSVAPQTARALVEPDGPEHPTPITPADNDERQGAEGFDAPPAPLRPPAVRTPPGRLTPTPAAYRPGLGRNLRPARELDANRAEIATSFIALTQDAALAAAEGGQVVRVELPRTALERFGLPMNVERADERVKADLLLGHDGVARAIRFVR